MTIANERFLVDGSGNRISVVLDIPQYKQILKDLEELESIRAFDEAKSSNDEAVPFDEALKEAAWSQEDKGQRGLAHPSRALPSNIRGRRRS